MKDLFNSFLNAGALNKLLVDSQARSSFQQKIEKIHKYNAQIEPKTLFQLAIHSVPNHFVRQKYFKKLETEPITMCCFPGLVGPLSLISIYYCGLRRVLSAGKFGIFMISFARSMTRVKLFPLIHGAQKRGRVVCSFVELMIQGILPNPGAIKAFGSLEFSDVLYYYILSPQSKSTKPWSPNSRNTRTFYRERSIPNRLPPRNGRLLYRPCRNCGQEVSNNRDSFLEHNKICPKKELQPRRNL